LGDRANTHFSHFGSTGGIPGLPFKIKTKAGVSYLHDHLEAVALAIERAAAVAQHERLRR